MVNWLSFVKDYREKHPEVSYKEALTICSPLYKKRLSPPKVAMPVEASHLLASSASCPSAGEVPVNVVSEKSDDVVESKPESKPVSSIEKPKRKPRAKKKPKSVEVKVQIQSETTSETNHL